MAKLARSQALMTGAFIHIALEAGAASDVSTKPSAASGLWLEVGCVQSVRHFPLTFSEEFSCPDPQLGLRDRKETHNMGDRYEITFRETNDLVERLQNALDAAIVEDTAQTPGVASTRMLRGWVKIQMRKPGGEDNMIEDLWCEIRPLDPPEAGAKATQIQGLELWVLTSTLNAINFPAAA